MLDTTTQHLTTKLPDILKMYADGLRLAEIAQAVGVSQPTMRAFLKAQGVTLSRKVMLSRTSFPVNEVRVGGFTDAELKLRRMGEMSQAELDAIAARLRAHGPARVRRRQKAHERRDAWDSHHLA